MSLLVVCEWPVLNIYLGDIDKQFRRVSFCQLLSSRLDQYRVSALELVTTSVVLPGFITYKLSNNRPGTLTCNRQRKTPWFSLRIIGAVNQGWYCGGTHRQGYISACGGEQCMLLWVLFGRCMHPGIQEVRSMQIYLVGYMLLRFGAGPFIEGKV